MSHIICCNFKRSSRIEVIRYPLMFHFPWWLLIIIVKNINIITAMTFIINSSGICQTGVGLSTWVSVYKIISLYLYLFLFYPNYFVTILWKAFWYNVALNRHQIGTESAPNQNPIKINRIRCANMPPMHHSCTTTPRCVHREWTTIHVCLHKICTHHL